MNFLRLHNLLHHVQYYEKYTLLSGEVHHLGVILSADHRVHLSQADTQLGTPWDGWS